ncbi:MAG: DUF4840 domain-containing protein [Prevotellaceae bacterium]|nr:DUF4840 domain-containing protein [Prevotellaceae bacterium]MDY6131103.1 DUF4840 domain-containing protein [Prevotella sp.]
MGKFGKQCMLMLLSAVVFSLTSCLNDGSELEKVDFGPYYKKIVGNFSGKTYFFTDGKKDSLMNMEVQANRDSSFTMYRVPCKLLSRNITYSEDLKKAIEARGTVDIKVNYSIYATEKDYIYMYLYAQPVVFKDVVYGNNKDDIAIAFVNGSYGIHKQDLVDLILVEGAVYVGQRLLEPFANTKISETDLKKLSIEFFGQRQGF